MNAFLNPLNLEKNKKKLSVSNVFYFKEFTDFKSKKTHPKLKKNQNRESLLLKVIFSDQTYGFTSLQTWEKLGDLSLNTHLRFLDKGYLTDLVQNAFYLATYYKSPFWEDLFKANQILNHYMITDILDFFQFLKSFGQKKGFSEEKSFNAFLDFLGNNRFKKIKIKLKKKNLKKQTEILKKLTSRFPSSFSLRLDFNNELNFSIFKNWLTQNPWVLKSLDFIEDPFSYHPKNWKFISEKFSVSLAFDRALNDFRLVEKSFLLNKDFKKSLSQYERQKELKESFFKLQGFDILVIKPAVQNVKMVFEKWNLLDQEKKESLKFVLTHNRDHWLGRLYALLEAKRFKNLLGLEFEKQFLDSGLLQEDLYKKSRSRFAIKGQKKREAFIELNSSQRKKMENYLEGLPWKPFCDFFSSLFFFFSSLILF